MKQHGALSVSREEPCQGKGPVSHLSISSLEDGFPLQSLIVCGGEGGERGLEGQWESTCWGGELYK